MNVPDSVNSRPFETAETQRRAAVKPLPEPQLAIIVPCYNSERTIGDCLRALLNQQTDIQFEIIVVDSSTDRTPEIVRVEFPAVRLIHLEQRTFAGAARNIGVRATQSPICLMIDSDCVAALDLVERMMVRHGEQTYAAVGGALRNGTPRSVSGLVSYLIEFKEFMPTTPLRLESSVPTANIAYRREVLERFGYFDEEMWLAEDVLFNWKLHRAGERILFDPMIEVTHLNRTGWSEVLSYQVSLGRMSAIARKRAGMPGKLLLDHPILLLLMPGVRTVRAMRWLAAHDRSLLLLFLCIWPLYLLAAGFWSYGFCLSALRECKNS